MIFLPYFVFSVDTFHIFALKRIKVKTGVCLLLLHCLAAWASLKVSKGQIGSVRVR